MVRPYRFGCIVDLFVGERYRQQGAGQLLLEACKRWAREHKLDYIELMVLENNKDGIRFYARERFAAVSRTMRLEL